MIPEGRYKARGGEATLAFTNDRNGQVAVDIVITEEGSEYEGQHRTWYGSFTEKSIDRTLQSLRLLGWQGDDLSDLSGLDQRDVWVTIVHEEYEGELRDRAAWINASPGLNVKTPMDEGDAKAFAQRMMGNVLAHRQKNGLPTPEGVAAKPAANSGSKKTQTKKPSTQSGDFAPDQAADDLPF